MQELHGAFSVTFVNLKSSYSLKVGSCFIQWEFLGLQAQETASQVTLREQFWESQFI